MRSRTAKLAVMLVLAAAIVALGAPAASARHSADYFQTNPAPAYSTADGTAASPSSPATVSGDGFDWGDAGIGATAVLALTAIAAGTLVMLRHRPSRGSLA